MNPAASPRPAAGLHVVIGAGPVGSTTARLLAEAGADVRILSRSGRGPDHARIERRSIDAADATAVKDATAGAVVVYNALNPAYHRWPVDWPPMHTAVMDAAAAHDAVLVLMDNLYAYGPTNGQVLTTDLPLSAPGSKGRVRAAMAEQLLDAHRDGRLRATIARASDFVGPEVANSHLGDRIIPRVLGGKGVKVMGSADVPHSFTYMPDVARTLITLGADERAWGRAWHVPSPEALTQREAIGRFAEVAGTKVKVGTMPHWLLTVGGRFSPLLRELDETWYQFAEPFVLDASDTTDTFGLAATPWSQIVPSTLDWFRDRDR